MKGSLIATCACAATIAHAQDWTSWGDSPLTPVSNAALVDAIKVEDLEAGAVALQKIADENDGTRVFGSPGHDATVEYLIEELEALGYYDVVKQVSLLVNESELCKT